MTKLELAKIVTSTIVGAGTGKIAGSIIRNHVQIETVVDTVTVGSASFVIGMMTADATKSYTNAKIDEAADWWKNNVTKN